MDTYGLIVSNQQMNREVNFWVEWNKDTGIVLHFRWLVEEGNLSVFLVISTVYKKGISIFLYAYFLEVLRFN